MGSKEVLITAIVDADSIYYRTEDLAKNFAILSDKIKLAKVSLFKLN